MKKFCLDLCKWMDENRAKAILSAVVGLLLGLLTELIL